MVNVPELFDQALSFHQSGELTQAEALYRRILQADPFYTNAYINLGIALLATGRGQDAIVCLQEAVRLNPTHADGYNNLGNALKDQGSLDDAVQCYRQALRLNPEHANAHNNLGTALVDKERLKEACASFREAVRINPRYASALNNLGNCLHDLGQSSEAIMWFRQALQFNPDHANALNNLGSALKELGQLSEAAICLRQALRINPNFTMAWTNLGSVLYEQGHVAEGEDCFRQALTIDPKFGLACFIRRFHRLRHANFEGAWEDFQQFEAITGIDLRYPNKPRWDGNDPNGKTILVYVRNSHQDLGDTLEFARYLPLIRKRGAKVVLVCQPALVKVLADFPGVDQLIPFGAPIPAFDYQIHIFHLLTVLRTTLDTIPAEIPYLTTDLKKVEYWRKVISEPSPCSSHLNVGIAWQGSNIRVHDRRSLALAHYEKLARVEGVRLFSLQVGPGKEQLTQAKFPVADLGSRFDANSLDDLAATIVSMDLVVTVDTAVAHLAGALGVPVWVALSLPACWRWLLDRSDSPWYPTMRLFRQTRFGDWDDVFENMAATLGKSCQE